MKNTLLFSLTMMMASFTFAGTSASSVRTHSGQLVSLGDSISEMTSRIGKSPISMSSYEMQQGDTSITVTDYVFEIENILYTFTLNNNKITQIKWDHKDS